MTYDHNNIIICSSSVVDRVRIHLKILYSNFLFIHHEAEVGIRFYMVKNTS